VEQMEEDGAIHLTIFQEQSHPSVDYFDMTVPVVLYGQGSEITYYCENSFSGEEYIFEFPGFKIDSAKFDPQHWLLAKLDYLNLGIDDAGSRNITIHPNPARESIRFFIPDSRILKVQIFNMSGQLILEKNISTVNEIQQLDITGLLKGMYLLVAKTEAGSFHGKFVKE